ncbi:UDP-glucose:undecaprenyl-phosphate glucose-1-phosphate transferase [termite gut metagenome]|uniref:UDP-glucose:undecaprenyl-phosphate glucose-1-phosphate transferase n=1 Tax=termite gut metagenome TaxID=433724 RepID=A0A5J4S9Y1_9ZZZZ
MNSNKTRNSSIKTKIHLTVIRNCIWSDINLTLQKVFSLQQSNHLKRSFDILFSFAVLLFLFSWIVLIIGSIIKITSPGPVFFSQKRTGKDGKEFWCIKFRSMRPNEEADTKQAVKDDPRVTPIGNFLRRTNLDELPQFINVLKGDMSVVGPRPHMLKHTEYYSERIEGYMLRHLVKPGITGFAQITGYRGETKELQEMEGRIKRDIWYIQHWSLLLDLKIIFRTMLQWVKKDKKAH